MRVVFLTGPSDIVNTYRHWRKGEDDPTQLAITYSGQLFDICRDLKLHLHAIATHPRHERVADDGFIIEHREIPKSPLHRIHYHAGQVRNTWELASWAKRCDLLITTNYDYMWLLGYFLPQTPIIVSQHNLVWSPYHQPSWYQKRLVRANLRFLRLRASGVVCIGDMVHQQIDPMHEYAHVRAFLPTYRKERFRDLDVCTSSEGPFRLLYLGRVTRDKGVFDLLETADRLRDENVVFDVGGDGPALEELAEAVSSRGLNDKVRLHGYCSYPESLQRMKASNAVFIPTTEDFTEGYTKTAVEARLAGRPLVASRAVPSALKLDGTSLVDPGDIDGYVRAVRTLLQKGTEDYDSTPTMQAYFNEEQSYGHHLRQLIQQFV